jgi:hypothetical protein
MLESQWSSYNPHEPQYNIVTEYKGSRTHYFYIELAIALRNFNLHSSQGNRSKITEETFKSEMKQLGWKYERKRISGELKNMFYRDEFKGFELPSDEEDSEGADL